MAKGGTRIPGTKGRGGGAVVRTGVEERGLRIARLIARQGARTRTVRAGTMRALQSGNLTPRQMSAIGRGIQGAGPVYVRGRLGPATSATRAQARAARGARGAVARGGPYRGGLRGRQQAANVARAALGRQRLPRVAMRRNAAGRRRA